MDGESLDALVLPVRHAKESASHYARRVLVYNIEHLKLKPGEQLQEMALAERMQLSRTPVREAILELKRSGIVEIYPRRGTYVSFLQEDNIRDLRFVYETALIGRACAQEPDAALYAQMMQNVRQQLEEGIRNRDRFFELDDEFHRLLYEMCGRESVYRMIRQHSLQFNRLRIISYDLQTTQELIAEHAAMADAIKNSSGDMGRAVMEHHLRRGVADYARIRRNYPGYFKPQEG